VLVINIANNSSENVAKLKYMAVTLTVHNLVQVHHSENDCHQSFCFSVCCLTMKIKMYGDFAWFYVGVTLFLTLRMLRNVFNP